MKESYSLGKAFAKFIKKNHHSIDIIYQNTWPLFSHFLVKNTKKVYVSQQQIFAILLIKGIPSHENLHNYSML